jgi:UDP-N-acetylglucosamine:LPS N-acetylglucosamine transferase
MLYSATGNGHKSVAQAISASITEISDANCRELEVFAAVQSPLIGGWPAAYSWMATRSVWLYDLLFRLTDTHWVNARICGLVYRFIRRKISRILQDIDPDVIVATAPFVSEIVSRARRYARADFRIVNVVTDLVTPHASWACREADVTVVCSPAAKRRLLQAGTREGKILETPFPVHRAFYEGGIGKEEARLQLGLQAERFTITLSGGGLGAGPVLSCAKALRNAFPEAQLLIVAGYNKHLYGLLNSQLQGGRIQVFGFTEQMPVLIRGSDVVVTKGGPSSIMEAYASQRPVVVVSEVGVQERGNGELVQHLGIGHYATSVEEMITIIQSLKDKIEVGNEEDCVPAANGSRAIAELILRQRPPVLLHGASDGS